MIVPEDRASSRHRQRATGCGSRVRTPALLVRGDDHLAALASVHRRLFAAHIDVNASAGVSDERAVETLGLDVDIP